MTDPLSLTGSAVGIISLGLSLCKTIVRYAQDVQGQSDDMKYLATKASNIRILLKNLRELIEETENDLPDVAVDFDSKALGLQVYLDRLKGPIEKYERAQAAARGMRSRARRTWETAIYHFKKEELFEVRDCLQSMEMDLNTALNVYSARELHKFGIKQDIFSLKQDLLLDKMDTLQLSITATSHQAIFQKPTFNSISCRESFSVQSYRTPVAYNRKNVRAKQGRKQYIYYINNWIQLFQSAVSEGKIRPTDELLANTFEGTHMSLLDLPFLWRVMLTPDALPGLCKYIRYMLDHNVTTNYRSSYSAFRWLCESFIWTEEAHNLASYIMERCGPINWAPRTWNGKRNMQSLLRRDADSVDLPSAFIAVLRESERDLRDLLDSKQPSCEDIFDGITLLQLAMGWPAGVRLLLKAQSGIHLPALYHRAYLNGIADKDNNIDDYSDCCNILLEAGYTISTYDISRSSSYTLTCLFIPELVKRRRKLLTIAEVNIHPSELSDLRKGETGIPDAYAPELCAALTTKGYKIDRTLMSFEAHSVYSYPLHPNILDKIYEAGFIDVDLPIRDGYTPLMARCGFSSHGSVNNGKHIGWLISKGADPFQKLPGSNTTVLHWINARLAECIHRDYKSDSHFDPYDALGHLHQIDIHLFSLTIRDNCSCSCSLVGCTPLSSAIRAVVDELFVDYQQITGVASRFRRFLEFLIDHNQSKLEVCHAMIRSLTFDGLSLSHTCCIELRYRIPWDYVRDESDLQEIREEQRIDLERFENLVSEFDAQFDVMGLPLMDFLQKIWYERMIKFLSERDKYDAEHAKQTRELGISLEVDEIQIPLVVQLICDQVRVVESDSEDS